MGRRRDERAGPDEVVEQRLGERRALGRVGARRRARRAGRASRARRASTIRMIERRWPENVESDWAIDCSSPMSAKTSRKTGSRLPGLGRDVEPGLVHQAEQPERPQRDRLAAGVRAGDDERRVAVAEADVDRDDPAGQPRVARRQQDRPRAGRRSRRRMPSISAASCALAAQRSNRASASSVSRSGVRVGARRAPTARRGSAPTSSALGDLRLAPGVAQLDRDERLDEQRLAAARRVVDDALDPRPGLGLDRHDVAAVAERDDRLLERAAELRADERVEPAAEPVVGDPDGRAQRRRGAARPCRAARRPGRSCGPASSGAPAAGGARGRARAAAAAARRRGASRAARSRRASRRSRGTAPGRGGRRGPRARSPGRCRAPPRSRRPGRSWRSARAWSVSSSAARDDDRVVRTARAPRPAAATAGTRSASASRARTAGTRGARSSGRPCGCRSAGPAGRETDGLPALDEPPRQRGPRLARVVDADPGRRDDVGGRLIGRARLEAERRRRDRTGRARSSARSMPNAAATRPGPARQPRRGSRGDPAPRRAAASAASGPSARASPGRRASTRIASMPVERLDGADEHRGGASARARSRR